MYDYANYKGKKSVREIEKIIIKQDLRFERMGYVRVKTHRHRERQRERERVGLTVFPSLW